MEEEKHLKRNIEKDLNPNWKGGKSYHICEHCGEYGYEAIVIWEHELNSMTPEQIVMKIGD